MGCYCSKKSHVLPSISHQSTVPKSQPRNPKPLSSKANSFPWLVKALSAPELNITSSRLLLRRKLKRNGSSLETSESFVKP